MGCRSVRMAMLAASLAWMTSAVPALAQHDIQAEVDRYIGWPGQALAYKIGELEITRMRREAEQQLGDKFDVREFHDTVLRRGAIPLPLLQQQVDRWVESVNQADAASN